MPIYEYQCKQCQYVFEALQKMTDVPLTTCPACHQEGAERMVSAAGFQLKGNGWYVTDFREKPKAGAVDSKPAGEAVTAAKTDGAVGEVSSSTTSSSSSSPSS
jgi:putative FmdB family regulatory protein